MIRISIIHIICQVECHGELDFQYMLCYQHSHLLNTHSDFSERGSVYWIGSSSGCGEYSDIRIYSNIFRYEYSFVSYSYHFCDANIFGYSFVLFFWFEYIRIFVRIIFLIRIYSDIRSYRFFIRIYSREKSNVCANRSKR